MNSPLHPNSLTLPSINLVSQRLPRPVLRVPLSGTESPLCLGVPFTEVDVSSRVYIPSLPVYSGTTKSPVLPVLLYLVSRRRLRDYQIDLLPTHLPLPPFLTLSVVLRLSL